MFQTHGDERGQLVDLEEFKDNPFEISMYIICMIQHLGAQENFTPIKH